MEAAERVKNNEIGESSLVRFIERGTLDAEDDTDGVGVIRWSIARRGPRGITRSNGKVELVGKG